MDLGRILEMKDRKGVEVDRDEEVHGSIVVAETCICGS